MKSIAQRILVPFDFSPQSEQALQVAGDVVASGGAITLLNAIAPVTSLAGIRPPGGPIWIAPPSLLAAERGRLEKIAGRVLGTSPRARVRCVVVPSEPIDAILAAARRADLIVMATTGRGTISHLVVGAVAEKVVRHSPIPVLTLGRQAAARLARRKQRRRMAA
jgi:nucleotide-binding universal stress UspA family protein